MAKNSDRNFSVVLATYTGAATINKTFKSLLSQQHIQADWEVIVVIDGPNEELKTKVKNFKNEFDVAGIPFKIEQFAKNKGRLQARLEGAKLAKYGFVLILDDRVELVKDYFKKVVSSKEDAIMPDVIEKQANNFVSLTLNRLRRRIYGNKWGKDFEPYYIDSDNFDKVPKGTAAFWITKKSFIEASESIAKTSSSAKAASDDTKVLKHIVKSGIKIYKDSAFKIYYEPRQRARVELVHIFHRAPKFIDYYFKPSSRYFLPLLIFYIGITPAVILFIIFFWQLLAAVLVLSLILTLLVENNFKYYPRVWVGLWAIFIAFGSGLIYGLIKKPFKF